MVDDFGVGKLVHTADFYDKVNTFTNDIPFYKELCTKIDGPVLELCCGTGRITVELAAAGINIEGLDFTESMLNGAKDKARKRGLSIKFHNGDMRDFSLNKKYKFIFIPFNSIQNTYTINDVEKTLNCVKKHLADDGTFALDVFNPDPSYLVWDKKRLEEIMNFKLDSGEHVVIKQAMQYDSKNQINRVKWHHIIDGKEHVEKLDMRCYFPLELEMLLKYNGFEIVEKYGDFDKSSFESSSFKQIFVCKKNPH